MPRHTIIPSRVLIVISTVVVALVLLLASSVQATLELPDLENSQAAQIDRPGYKTTGYETADYKVRSGDSLWGIADEHTPDHRDVRNTVEAIKRVNGLDSSVIHPGQLLAIPLVAKG